MRGNAHEARRTRLRYGDPVRVRPGAQLRLVEEEPTPILPASNDPGAGQVRRATVSRLRRGLAGLLLLIAVAITVAVSIQSPGFLYLLYVGVSFALGAISATTLVWALDAWKTPGSLPASGFEFEGLEPTESFSLIVPARHEKAVLDVTLARLTASDHPAFEVVVVVGNDDPGTRAVAERAAARHPDVFKVVVDPSWPKNKPKALNAALPYCTGTVIGVFDAEDIVHPALLRRVDECFQKTAADIVQAGIQLMNFHSSWLAVRNVLEYYFWFRSRLHLHARQRFIPLGGNTVFIRTPVLAAVEGWDSDCLAEDCELGVRLSALGARTAVFYEPDLVTREECPPTLAAFVRQRTRWNQGYLQTLSRGYWRSLPFRQRALGAYILAMPYLMAIAWLLVPAAIATALALKAPVGITLLSFLPLLPTLSMLVVEITALGEFCREYGERASPRDYLRLVLGFPLYQLVLAYAAARAVVREVRGARGWEKTVHLGLHLPSSAQPLAECPAGHLPRLGTRTHEPAISSPVVRRLRAADASMAGLVDSGGTAALRPAPFGPVGVGFVWKPYGGGPADSSDVLSLPVRGATRVGSQRSTWLSDASVRIGRLVHSHVDVVVQVTLVACVAAVLATNLFHWPDTQFDEGTYVANAWAVQHGVLAPYTYSYGHPPLAWLLIFLATWVSGVFGHASFSIDGGRELMLGVCLISCSLLYTLARRLQFARVFAAGAVILFALSPVAIFYHRAVLLDNPSIAWALAAFVLALTPRRRLWAFAASGVCFGASVLSKETTIILLPALVMAAAQNTDKRTARYCVTLFASFLALIALTYPLYAILKGELLPGRGHVSLVGYMIVQLLTRKGTGSVFDLHSETHAIVATWLQLDPWLLGAALALAPIALARRSTRPAAVAYLIQVALILRPGYLPNMYVIGLLPFGALIVTGSLEHLWRGMQASAFGWRRWSRGIVIVAALLPIAVSWGGRWVANDRQAMTVRLDGSRRAADRWLVDHVGRTKRLIVTDDVWIYLIEHGFDAHKMKGGFYSRTVVSYWPLDYDPAVKQRFPQGWRDFDYVVVNQDMRVTMTSTPTAAEAVAHSHVVASFGHGSQLIQIRAIEPAPAGRSRID
jgi:glycosyltransferase XagB